MNKFYIYGASGHGKVVLDVALAQKMKPVAFIDDNDSIKTFQGYAVERKLSKGSSYIIAIGDNRIRKVVYENESDYNLVSVIHPEASISKSSVVGTGTFAGVRTVINSASSIGANCIINTAAVVEHDCIISDLVHISPNATICGQVLIGEGTHIGAGAVVLPGIQIGKWATIGAGAVVTKNVPDGAMVVGNPAKIINS